MTVKHKACLAGKVGIVDYHLVDGDGCVAGNPGAKIIIHLDRYFIADTAEGMLKGELNLVSIFWLLGVFALKTRSFLCVHFTFLKTDTATILFVL